MTTLYGAGLQKYNKGGILSYEHGGGAQGASCYFAQFPDFNTSIILLANTDEINAMAIYEEIKSIVFQEEQDKIEGFKKLDSNNNWHKLETAALQSFEGKYYGFGNESASTFDIAITGKDTLNGNSFGRPARKYVQSNSQEFSAVEILDLRLKIQAASLSIHYQQYEIGSFQKMNPQKDIELQKIIGSYSSSTINEGVWNISKIGEDIMVVTPREKSYTLIKLAENLYHLKEMNILLLFLSDKNSLSLKLIHQGAGEIILQKI